MKNTFSNQGNEIQDIISNKPPFIVRWGTVFFFLMLLLLVLISWLIKYPDIVVVKAKLVYHDSQEYAEIYIPPFNFSKVKAGQQVIIKVPSYPSQEYGSLSGEIEYIAVIPTDSGYLAKVHLPKGFITNYNKDIPYTTGLSGQGEVITEKIRLLERFYLNMIKTTKK